MFKIAVSVCLPMIMGFASAQTPDGVYRVGGAVSPPRVVAKADPEYTEEARRAHVNASVQLNIVVNGDGTVRNARVVRGAGFGMDEKAISAVNGWKFQPAMKEGAAVAVMATVEVNFRLLDQTRAAQTARLLFTQPEGASRPVLQAGRIPENPVETGDQFLRIGFTVGEDGKPGQFQVLETTSEAWAQAALHTLEGWRFTSAMQQGAAVSANAVLQVARGREPVRK